MFTLEVVLKLSDLGPLTNTEGHPQRHGLGIGTFKNCHVIETCIAVESPAQREVGWEGGGNTELWSNHTWVEVSALPFLTL